MPPTQVEVPLDFSSLMVVYLSGGIDMLGLHILPVLPMLAKAYDVGSSELGFIFVAYGGAQMISMPLFGKLSDKIGRKRVTMTGPGSTIGFFCRVCPGHTCGSCLPGMCGTLRFYYSRGFSLHCGVTTGGASSISQVFQVSLLLRFSSDRQLEWSFTIHTVHTDVCVQWLGIRRIDHGLYLSEGSPAYLRSQERRRRRRRRKRRKR